MEKETEKGDSKKEEEKERRYASAAFNIGGEDKELTTTKGH